jgi:hypothetical protein
MSIQSNILTLLFCRLCEKLKNITKQTDSLQTTTIFPYDPNGRYLIYLFLLTFYTNLYMFLMIHPIFYLPFIYTYTHIHIYIYTHYAAHLAGLISFFFLLSTNNNDRIL